MQSMSPNVPAITITQSELLKALIDHIGEAKGIKADNLVYKITGSNPKPGTGRQIRALITNLRMKGHHICGHPKSGYYLADTPEELNDTCRFLMQRIETGLKQVAAMKKVSMPDLYGQMNLLK